MSIEERPILFSGEMPRATLEKRKTQTRRVVKFNLSGRVERAGRQWHIDDPSAVLACPYGQIGDRLWVKEEHYRFGHWEPVPGVKTKTGRMKWRFVADTDEVLYSPPAEFRKGRHHHDPETSAWHKRLGRFMPRSAARTLLEIVDIRVERLLDISEEDAIAEGCQGEQVRLPDTCYGSGGEIVGYSAKTDFIALWDSINAKRGYYWEDNPLVWVIEFRRVEL